MKAENATGVISLLVVVIKNKQMEKIEQDRKRLGSILFDVMVEHNQTIKLDYVR